MQTITIWFDEQPVIIYQTVADMLRIKDGYQVSTEGELMDIINANMSFCLLRGSVEITLN
jgi:hypothetical protein